MAKLILALLVIIFVFEIASAQRQKPGNCPNSSGGSGVGICAFTCKNDFSCAGRQKCCRTACGGSSCSEPSNNTNTIKLGRCPPPTINCFQAVCRSDAECSGNKKCCSGNCLCVAPIYSGK